LEDVVRLGDREVEDLAQALTRGLHIVGGPDELDHLIDIEDRDEETLDEVEALLPTREAVLAATPDHGDAVVEIDAKQLAQAERVRTAADEGDVIDRETVLERGEAIQLLEHGIRAEPGLDADDQAQAVLAIREVLDVLDSRDLLGLDAVLD